MPPRDGKGSIMKALIVEDNAELAFLWSEVLGEIGFEANHVDTTRDAMSQTLRHDFDLFILDLFVKDGSTISLSDWLSLRAPNTPVIMITGSAELPKGEHTTVATGVSWLLRKPVKVADLQAMADHLCRTVHQQSA